MMEPQEPEKQGFFTFYHTKDDYPPLAISLVFLFLGVLFMFGILQIPYLVGWGVIVFVLLAAAYTYFYLWSACKEQPGNALEKNSKNNEG